MPWYEWQHTSNPECSHITSVVNRVEDYNKPPEKCDKCGYEGPDWKKVIGKANFLLMGGGWARTGYQK
jgi:predicted nucleic acid-binding Zn ribbon protein